MIDTVLNIIKRLIPSKIFTLFQPIYHWKLSFLAALWYRFPSRNIRVIAVTGTKGKSSTVEILNAILEEAGYKTALSNTIRFKIGEKSEKNLFKMSMPGRFMMQKLLRQAVSAGCAYFIAEMTSQGALLFRHKFIDIDTLIFTNLSPEHIEAHGSYEKYVQAKLSIAKALAHSNKKTTLIVNNDEKEAQRFLECDADKKITYSLRDAEPFETKLPGTFNQYNILAAATCARNEGVAEEIIKKALAKFELIPGRVEKVEAGQDFIVIVDYAHTADSLEKLYKVFAGKRLIAVLGGTGGGRDTSKRAVMGALADKYCDTVILTNEDPYDEDPNKIIADVAKGVTSKKPFIIMDRREAIREALRNAHTGDVVLITGKGTDPYIMGPNGTKLTWSDANVAREELISSLSNRSGSKPL